MTQSAAFDSALKPYRQRQFVPAQIDLGSWEQIAPLFDSLEKQFASVDSLYTLEQWLDRWSELSAALSEENSRRYISMTCQTDDPASEKCYLDFIEKIDPNLKSANFKLTKLLSASPLKKQLPAQRYSTHIRSVDNYVELFREENIPVETEIAKLSQSYQKTIGAMTVNYQGEEKTLTQMSRLLEEPERKLREEAWTLIAGRRLQDTDSLDQAFDDLRKLRAQIARNSGFENFRDYTFRNFERFDYTPADCEAFHEAVAECFVPIARELQTKRAEKMGLDKLRPWDLSVDPDNLAPLKPFTTADDFLEKADRVFARLDKGLQEEFQILVRNNLLDLENRKGKAPGGYQSTLSESRLPFIFMNAVGVQRDVETLVHEAGHAFHALATREEDLYFLRGAPIEFCEVASMSMELLTSSFLEEFYSPDEAKRARKVHLEGIIKVFPWIAQVDAFQHWIYTHPDHTVEERRAAWRKLHARFGGIEDYSGFEPALESAWHRQLHIFEYPFYYIEYGIAQLGALQVWQNYRRDPRKALADYKSGLSLGSKATLPDLFKAVGAKFDFSKSAIAPLAQFVRDELNTLE